MPILYIRCVIGMNERIREHISYLIQHLDELMNPNAPYWAEMKEKKEFIDILRWKFFELFIERQRLMHILIANHFGIEDFKSSLKNEIDYKQLWTQIDTNWPRKSQLTENEKIELIKSARDRLVKVFDNLSPKCQQERKQVLGKNEHLSELYFLDQSMIGMKGYGFNAQERHFTAVVLVNNSYQYYGHVYFWIEDKRCRMMVIRTSIENILQGCDQKGLKDVGKRLLQGTRDLCAQLCGSSSKRCQDTLVVDTPEGPMPNFLWNLGFRPYLPDTYQFLEQAAQPPKIVPRSANLVDYGLDKIEKYTFYSE